MEAVLGREIFPPVCPPVSRTDYLRRRGVSRCCSVFLLANDLLMDLGMSLSHFDRITTFDIRCHPSGLVVCGVPVVVTHHDLVSSDFLCLSFPPHFVPSLTERL